MNRKKEVFALLVLLVMPFVIGAMYSEYVGEDYQESIFDDSVSNFRYTYALGIKGGNDDTGGGTGTSACQNVPITGDQYAAESISGIFNQQKSDSTLNVLFPRERYYDASAYEEFFGTGDNRDGQCLWEGLPLNGNEGCYFLTSEPDDENPNDCAGWFIPQGEGSVIPSTRIERPIDHFFPDNGGSFYQNSFADVFQNYAQYLIQGQAMTDYSSAGAGNAICTFEAHHFYYPEKAFICLLQQNEHRWYICDENNLYDATGKFIPIEPVSECDDTIPCTEGTCQNNVCVDEAGQPIQTDKAAWVCEKNLDGTYAWNGEHALTCADLETLGESCHTDEQVCNSQGFSWLETNEGSYCCGYNGIEDLGHREKTSRDQNYICLNKNEGLVGRDTTSDPFAGCESNWCWLEAAIQDNAFRIFTLKKPGQAAYDVVSNNNDWYACDGIDGEGNHGISAAGAIFNPEDTDDANRFYCYKEGNRWSWADCRDPNELTSPSVNGIKERSQGDGLFAFPIQTAAEAAGTETVFVDISAAYASFYGDGRLDFKGYDPMYLEFYLRFKMLNTEVPPGVRLKIQGPQQEGQSVIYYDQPILGYAANNPLLEANRWIHLKVPLSGEMLDVKSIEIKSMGRGNTIEVQNMYLSDGSSRICSGTRSSTAEESSWLTDLDFSSSQSTLSAEKLCNALFDPAYENTPEYQGKAWLGDFDVVDLPERNCCGNNENEYYAGPSRLIDGKYYGCWNSEPIASGDTTMNVEFEVEYTKSEVIISERNPLNYRGAVQLQYDYDHTERFVVSGDTGDRDTPASLESEWIIIELSSGPGPHLSLLGGEFSGSITPGEKVILEIPNAENIELQREDRFTAEYTENGERISAPHKDIYVLKKVEFQNENQDNYQANFLNTLTGDISEDIDGEEWHVSNNYNIIIEAIYLPQISISNSPETSTATFTCPPSEQSECSYPLPGEPPYTITNSHPDLYELYFVPKVETGSPSPKLITATNNHFTTSGMIQARKVAQQVIFINEGEDADEDPSFYGCQAAKFLEENVDGTARFEIVPYCDAQVGKFCAPSAAQEDRREKFTTINSWDDAEITKVGYAPIDQVEGNINNFYDSIELQLRDLSPAMPYEEAPVKRNYSASVLPTRNFISNTQFLRSGMVIPHWDIRLSDGTRKENLRSNLVNDELHSITLEGDETLRSEQIAVPANTKLSFSATTTCTPTIKLVDKDGVVVPITVPTSFNTGTASYLQLEFTGACTLHSPLLQVVDDLPPVSFNYLHQEYPDGFDARAGAACCPQNYCWNGYACVAPMGSSTYLAEHVADGRDYRCIEGKWKYLPLQFDWNGQNWGFCSRPEQCLVLPSTSSGSAEYKASDFYDGHYPACIDDKEYVFDHLCNKGNWTSRTKYVATKLLEVGENSDYVLYCADYRQALLEFDGKENYLGGEFVQQPQNVPTLAGTLAPAAPSAGLATCFNTIQDPEGRRLVPDEENTCINNVCVLKFKQGGNFKVAFATTLNKDPLKEDSFLFALNIPQNRLDQLCTGSGEVVKCDLTGLNIPGDLWYAKKINATFYGWEGLQLTPTLIDRILTWLARFVGVQSELSDESAFISRAQNFRDVYVLSLGDKKVRALKEVLSADKQTLLAEYEHFNTPVCDYVQNIAVPPEAGTELLEQLSGQQKIICTYNNNTGIQRVEAVAGLDFFWPQLTGRMRVG